MNNLQEIYRNITQQKVKDGIPKSISGVTFVSSCAFKATAETFKGYKVLLPGDEKIPEKVNELLRKFCLKPEEEGVLDYGNGNYLIHSGAISLISGSGAKSYFSVASS